MVSKGLKEFNLPPDSFQAVDLEKFSGSWYEVARSPNVFERGCDYSVAEYTIVKRDNDIVGYDVMNTCYSNGTPSRSIKGVAKVSMLPYAFCVSFPPVSFSIIPNYIVAWVSSSINQKYQRAVILSPLGNVWFLSRSKQISDGEYEEMLAYVPFSFLRARIHRNTII